MFSFRDTIKIIGINPYVLPPEAVLKKLFNQAKQDRGAIPIKGKINGHPFLQTLVKYSGKWRLYLNTPMRTATNTTVGDTVTIHVEHDPVERKIPMHPQLKKSLDNDATAKNAFDKLSPSRQKEIVRYINHLKTEESILRNIKKAILFLKGKENFVGRSTP